MEIGRDSQQGLTAILAWNQRLRQSSSNGFGRPVFNGGVLRIGAFGATRPRKNLMSAAGAAIELYEELKVDTEFWISGGRLEGGGNTILNSVRAMTVNIPGFTLKECGW
jgi:hypothetical protein